jgi:UDP-N-acetylglucosamine transferase subunit ALG13
MKAEIKKNEGQLQVVIDCTPVELRAIAEGLQQAQTEAVQKFGTHLVKQVNKLESK